MKITTEYTEEPQRRLQLINSVALCGEINNEDNHRVHRGTTEKIAID